mgnify:FL=1
MFQHQLTPMIKTDSKSKVGAEKQTRFLFNWMSICIFELGICKIHIG